MHLDYINLGFSGSAKGEDVIRDYVSGLSMSAFVLDYDHNAPNPEHLEKTHEAFFKSVRESHKDIPIIMMTRPKSHPTQEELKRIEIVKKTYENAINNNDKNVYFIDGRTFFPDFATEYSLVDNVHPNDLGFAFIADKLTKLFKEIFSL